MAVNVPWIMRITAANTIQPTQPDISRYPDWLVS